MCHSFHMGKESVVAILREHAAELRAAGVLHLCLFGSIARGEGAVASDIDLMAEFDPSRRLTLVTLGGLETRLADLLGAKVDLTSTQWMRETVREQALREAVLAF